MAATWLAVKVVLLINPPRLWLLSGEEAEATLLTSFRYNVIQIQANVTIAKQCLLVTLT